MKTAIVLLMAAALCGCQGVKKVTRTDLDIETPDGKRFRLRNPKELVFDKLTIDPKTGKLEITGYRSVASEAAIQGAIAEGQSRDKLVTEVIKLTDKLADRGAAAYGIPTGYKVAPKDDPSTPQLVYPDQAN